MSSISNRKEKDMLNKEEIKDIIPQREPFLMIDEVEEYIPGESCIAYKDVDENEQLQFFQWMKIKEKMLYLVELRK